MEPLTREFILWAEEREIQCNNYPLVNIMVMTGEQSLPGRYGNYINIARTQ
jgi:hypothetical protein